MPLFNYRLDLEYDGTDFVGWQYQTGQRTVQDCVERAVRVLFNQEARVSAAGRTDAGVHASGQVAGFRADHFRSFETAVRALNANLPEDIRIRRVSLELPEWHPRFSAKWRSYRYTICKAPMAIGRGYAWYYPRKLDVQAMDDAARFLQGSHCFRAFAHDSPTEKHYLSDVFKVVWIEDNNNYIFTIDANRFLHGMVRLLVGTFVAVGRGKIGPKSVEEILQSQDVRMAGAKAPARGLTLIGVGYQDWIPES